MRTAVVLLIVLILGAIGAAVAVGVSAIQHQPTSSTSTRSTP